MGREFSVTHKTNHQLSFPHGASIQKPLLRTTICQPAGSIIGMLKLEASGCPASIYSSSCQYLPKLQKRSLRSVSIANLLTVDSGDGAQWSRRTTSSTIISLTSTMDYHIIQTYAFHLYTSHGVCSRFLSSDCRPSLFKQQRSYNISNV